MKKVFLLLLVVASLGGYQIFSSNSPSSKGAVHTQKFPQADILNKNGTCTNLKKKIEKDFSQNESISSLFYSNKTYSCIYEKRTKKNDAIIMELIDAQTQHTYTSWSSSDVNKSYKDYRDIQKKYRMQ